MTSEPLRSLRITARYHSDSFRFDLELTSEGRTPRHANGVYTQLGFEVLSEVRWYMEEFLEERDRPAQIRANQVRKLMREAGVNLFREVFQANEQTKEIWGQLIRSKKKYDSQYGSTT